MLLKKSPPCAADHRIAGLSDIHEHLLISPMSVWLDVARRAKLTDHYDLLEWIIGQPECDANIAQLIFYRANPARHLRNRTTMDPAAVHRDALCLTIIELAEEGHYTTAKVGLKWSELDRQRGDLIRALQDVPAQDRVFEVPDVLLMTHDLPETKMDPQWSPEVDTDIAELYADAGLIGAYTPKASLSSGPKPDSVLGDFVSMLRPPLPKTA